MEFDKVKELATLLENSSLTKLRLEEDGTVPELEAEPPQQLVSVAAPAVAAPATVAPVIWRRSPRPSCARQVPPWTIVMTHLRHTGKLAREGSYAGARRAPSPRRSSCMWGSVKKGDTSAS